MTWREVARVTGYQNEIVAQLAVTAYLQKAAITTSEDQAREALALELARYDALQESWWDAAQRDEKAAMVLLRVSAQRVKIYELLFASKDASATPRTIVISGDTEEYVAGLKAIALGNSDSDPDE